MKPPKRATLKEVARLAGVSYQTVSKVLNGQVRLPAATEARIWEAVQALNYIPNHTARSLRSRRSHTIAYCWAPTATGQANPILDELLQSMVQAAERQGYYLLCFPNQPDPQRLREAYRELIDSGRVDGFILSSVEYEDPRILYLMERRFPFVAFGRSNPEYQFPSIDIDGGLGMLKVVRHLVERGHRRIAALTWPPESRVGANRIAGFLQGLIEAGIPPVPEWMERGEGVPAFGYQATLRLLALPESMRPTAIVAFNDAMALGAVRAAQQLGYRVGSEIAITGFDDTPLARYTIPPLTSVRQPIWEVGDRLVNRLITLLDHPDISSPYCELIEPELIIRASSTGEEIPLDQDHPYLYP
jgi:DNA-binding LacI/PurR family transcriptional regulator